MNTDARYEERDMVDAAVRELSIKHTAIQLSTDNFIGNLRDLVRNHDSPVSTISYYAQSHLMKALHEAGYKVSVSGTGADELFSGYFDHHNAYLAAMKVENPERYVQAKREWQSVVGQTVRNPYLQDPDYFVKQPDARGHIFLGSHEFSQMLTTPFLEPFSEEIYSKVLLRNRMANELLHETVPVILHEDDLNAMHFSVENRSPYLDKMLFELAQSIPTRHLLRRGRAKAVLRDAVRGLTPDPVRDNPRKVGFNVPLIDYLDFGDDAVADEVLEDSPIFQIVNRNAIIRLFGKPELANSESKFLFNFMNAKLFLEEHAA